MSDDQSIPQLAPGSDPLDLAQSPAEGFLLSRIDGHTPWSVLRQIGGLSPDEVDECLHSWLAAGVVVCDGGEPPKPDLPPADRRPATEAELECLLAPELDIPIDKQREILRVEASLNHVSYWELLGVGPDDDEKAIKRAYFKLSKRFHPDRYYRRETGGFEIRLETIFKKLVEAYELLSDPGTRAELQRSMGAVAPSGPAVEPPPTMALPAPESAVQRPIAAKLSKKERQRQALQRLRKHFAIPQKILIARRFQASQFYQSAQVAMHRKNWKEAASSARLAIAFDPWNPAYKEGFSEILGKVHQMRAEELLAEASMDSRSSLEALRLYEDALTYRPCDPEVYDRTAQVAIDANELEKGREYAETACELAPDVADYHLTRGRVLRRAGLNDKAKEALDEASRIDPQVSGLLEELKLLRRTKRRK